MNDKEKIIKFLSYFIQHYKLTGYNITPEKIYKWIQYDITYNNEYELNKKIINICNNTIYYDNLNYNKL